MGTSKDHDWARFCTRINENLHPQHKKANFHQKAEAASAVGNNAVPKEDELLQHSKMCTPVMLYVAIKHIIPSKATPGKEKDILKEALKEVVDNLPQHGKRHELQGFVKTVSDQNLIEAIFEILSHEHLDHLRVGQAWLC